LSPVACQIISSNGISPQGNTNCKPFPSDRLKSDQCTKDKREQASYLKNVGSRDFADFNQLFHDAANIEDAKDFLVDQLVWMYRYLHCTSQIEAISSLFYNVDPNNLPAPESPFWRIAYDYLHQGGLTQANGIAPIGRRRRREVYDADDSFTIQKNQKHHK